MSGADFTAGSEVEARLDPRQSHFIFICGRKGTGKSVLAERLARSYPYDLEVIDVTGSVAKGYGAEPQFRQLRDPLPARWPERLFAGEEDAHVPQRLIYVPDAGSKTFAEDVDQAVGLGYRHGHCAEWIEEIGIIAPAGRTQPNMRRALHHGRHQDLTLIMTGPRAMDVDPLTIANSDYVYVFELPNPADRKRVADCIGWEPKDLDAAVSELPRHGYLRYDARGHELIEFPPLPYRKPIAQRDDTALIPETQRA